MDRLEETRPAWLVDTRLLEEAVPFETWDGHISNAFRFIKADGLYCEFGVHAGGSMNYFLSISSFKFHGFDSFKGLQEKWLDFEIGHLDMKGERPKFNGDRVELHEGFFEDTLPEFVSKHPEPVYFMHVDCDLYSSTKTIFKYLMDRVRKGTIIVFDEYITGIDDERKAFLETGLPFRYISRHHNGGSVAVRIT